MAQRKKAVSLLVLLLSCTSWCANAGGTSRNFVTHDLLTHLANDPVFDWNRVASLSFPLAMRARRGEVADLRPLSTVAYLLGKIDILNISCSDAKNAALTASFLFDAGVPISPSPGAIKRRLAHCRDGSSPFETVNTLLFRCRSGRTRDKRQAIGAAVARIGALQQADGRFTWPGLSFLESYYFTSHALIALHACGMSSTAVLHVQDYLRQTLPLFRHAGFLDGLAESLIFLAWTTANVAPKWATHVDFLRSRVKSDGGICFVDRPGCISHWHTTALMAELESLDIFLHKNGVLPSGPFTPCE